MSKIRQAAKRYWESSKTNIFRNYIDALLGIPVLLLCPLISLLYVAFSDAGGLGEYVFPIASICFAGAYDAYGRYERDNSRNFKLGIRVAIDFLSIITALVFCHHKCMLLKLISPTLLLFPGVLIAKEAYIRISTAIQMSPWYNELGGEDVDDA